MTQEQPKFKVGDVVDWDGPCANYNRERFGAGPFKIKHISYGDVFHLCGVDDSPRLEPWANPHDLRFCGADLRSCIFLNEAIRTLSEEQDAKSKQRKA